MADVRTPTESVLPIADLVQQLVGPLVEGGPTRILGIDGRSSAGKSTLSGRVAATIPGSVVVHTDDVAWNQARFEWADLLVEFVLRPIRLREPVTFRPPAWDKHGRDGLIEVRRGCSLLVVEGVGVTRASLRPFLDGLLWVETDPALAERRDLARVGTPGGAASASAVREWMTEEHPFLAREQPWRFAEQIVAGASDVPHDRETEVVLLESPRFADGPAPRHT